MWWWFTHMIRMVKKLVKKAKNAGHSETRPLNRAPPAPVTGSRRFRTRRVIANAKRPSLKASRRPVSFSSTFFDFSSAKCESLSMVWRDISVYSFSANCMPSYLLLDFGSGGSLFRPRSPVLAIGASFFEEMFLTDLGSTFIFLSFDARLSRASASAMTRSSFTALKISEDCGISTTSSFSRTLSSISPDRAPFLLPYFSRTIFRNLWTVSLEREIVKLVIRRHIRIKYISITY